MNSVSKFPLGSRKGKPAQNRSRFPTSRSKPQAMTSIQSTCSQVLWQQSRDAANGIGSDLLKFTDPSSA